VMEQAGYGRTEEWRKPGRKPSLDADERIVAVQRKGLVTRQGDTVYHGWDVFFRVDAVKPKGSDAPLAGLTSEVEVTSDDADREVALWNRELPEHDGLLEATPV